MEYKGTKPVEGVLIPELDEYVRYQEENGMVERDWEVRTLEETPFFRNWQAKYDPGNGIQKYYVEQKLTN